MNTIKKLFPALLIVISMGFLPSSSFADELCFSNEPAVTGFTGFGNSTTLEKLAVAFTPVDDCSITSAVAQMTTAANSVGQSIYFQIYSDSSGLPGTLLITGSAFVTDFTANVYIPITSVFSGAVTLNAGTTYWLSATKSVIASPSIRWGRGSGGGLSSSFFSDGAWTSASNRDLVFSVYEPTPAPPPAGGLQELIDQADQKFDETTGDPHISEVVDWAADNFTLVFIAYAFMFLLYIAPWLGVLALIVLIVYFWVQYLLQKK